jgi:excisionase family DNA binding protein
MTTATSFDQDRMSRQAAADYIGKAKSTLDNWASTGYADLPFYKVGGTVYYRRTDLDKWLEKQKRTHTEM